ncbi:MAG: radical SAM protein [Clostridiales Family XIII bacterium]|jgi:anaerobic ribonucleoside-triphosphate reductase activating protein|nr:radical SAM protein [Clostridiales Family XIII bacterium]
MIHEKTIDVAGIIEDSIVDGPGLRMAIFVQGCDKRCVGCHNPEAQPVSGGTPYTIEALLEKIAANPILSGVTFSGGEPMLQAAALLSLAEQIKAKGLDLAIYTGDTLEEILKKGDEAELRLLSFADVLIDGPFVLEQRSLAIPFRGSANQRILDLPKSLAAGEAVPVTNPAWGT